MKFSHHCPRSDMPISGSWYIVLPTLVASHIAIVWPGWGEMGKEQRQELGITLFLYFLFDCLTTMNSDFWVVQMNSPPQLIWPMEFSGGIRPFHPPGTNPATSHNYCPKNNSSVRRHHGWLCSTGKPSILCSGGRGGAIKKCSASQVTHSLLPNHLKINTCLVNWDFWNTIACSKASGPCG